MGSVLVMALALVEVAPAQAPARTSDRSARRPGAATADVVDAISCNAPAGTRLAPALRLAWRGDDVQWSEWPVRLGARGIPVRVVAVIFDPRRLRLALDLVQQDGVLQPWHLDAAPADARVALNAGQFSDDGPWGWVVHRGREWQAPGSGSLAGAFVTDTAGVVDIITAADIAGWRGSPTLREALQSYPMLLEGDGTPPAALCPATAQVDLSHRDTRLAVGVRRDGWVIIALSRYAGGTLPDRTPIGPTTPEMAEVMRRLGAVRALMLDGGLSAQLLVRDRAGAAPRRWQGLRNVPLALVAKR